MYEQKRIPDMKASDRLWVQHALMDAEMEARKPEGTITKHIRKLKEQREAALADACAALARADAYRHEADFYYRRARFFIGVAGIAIGLALMGWLR